MNKRTTKLLNQIQSFAKMIEHNNKSLDNAKLYWGFSQDYALTIINLVKEIKSNMELSK